MAYGILLFSLFLHKLDMLYSVGFICLALVLPAQGTPSFVFVSTGNDTIDEGHVVFLHYRVVDQTDNHSISWYREAITGDKTVIYRDGVLINNDLGREAEAYTLYNGSVRIIQYRGRDLGPLLNGNNYTCEVTEKEEGKVVLVSSGFILDARYSPSSLYPICESCGFSSNLTGSTVTISCYSELGNPWVQLQWSRNGEAIENLMPVTIHSYIYLNYTFILKADDLESNFSCTNGIQSCKLTTDQASAEGCSPINSDAPQIPSTVIARTDKDEEESSPKMLLDVETSMCQSSTTIVVLSVIIAVLVAIVVTQIAVIGKLRQRKKANKGIEITTTGVQDQTPDYINVKQSTDNRSFRTYENLKPREEANYSSMQNPQHKENNQDLEMLTTVPDPAPDYINVKQLTTNLKI